MFGFGASDRELLLRVCSQPWKVLRRESEVRRPRERQRELSSRALRGMLALQTPLMLQHALRRWKDAGGDCCRTRGQSGMANEQQFAAEMRRNREHQQKAVQSCLAEMRGDNRAVMDASVLTAWRDVVEKGKQVRRHAAKMFGLGAADLELLSRACRSLGRFCCGIRR